MYCAKCGVKLAATEHSCPLCGTRAHPDLWQQVETPMYPRQKQPEVHVSSRNIMLLVTMLFVLPAVICLQCDLLVTGELSWSGYVISALLTIYVCGVLPAWFRKPNPVIFVPCGFAAVGVMLLYISLATKGGWFLSFAFPVTGFVCLVVTAVVALLRYVRRGSLYVYGGALCALGAFMPLMGFLVNLTFFEPAFALWSLYPMTPLLLLGGMLIFLAICRPARETMQRKFFI